MAAEMATSIATIIFDHSLGAIARQFGYLWNHKKNMINLKLQVEKLDNVRDDTNHSVLAAQKNAEMIKSQVKSWQNNAEKISAEARNVMEEYEEKAKGRCLIGLCPNLVLHYQLSRKSCKKQIEIVEVLREPEQFKGVSERAIRRAMSIPSTVGYFAFDSRMSTLEEIVNALQDATKNSIGVYGFGGMGKTTLVKQVLSQVAEKGTFDEIVMALVSQMPDLKEIQGQLAKKLDLKLEESSVAERAGRIYGRLKEKKVLVILDDLWGKLDLEKVGIPFDDKHMGCKILLTSRFQDILSAMGAKSIFHLGALEEKEAWSLFEEKTRDVIKDLAFLNIGEEVAKRCAGLPVLIVTVGASLSSRPNLHAWKEALNQLKKMKDKEMHEFVNSAMEFISYQHLEEPHKRLFLLCGLVGSGVPIAVLLKYSLGWGLFDEVGRVEDARNKLHTLILELKASCLLLNGNNEDIIEIHDVVRGVAVSIARKDLNMFSAGDSDTDLKRWPQDDVLGRCTALVFHASRSPLCLFERLKCPSLELLILSEFSQDFSLTIPNTYFEMTRMLKVLDMSKMSFQTLPPSISFLGNLQTLRLDSCNRLEDISIVGELKKLQVLSLAGSNIEELSREIGQLSELRLLDLSGCLKLQVIPEGVLRGLSQLEELYMIRSFSRWEAREDLSSSGTSNVSLAELKDLPNLCSLEIEVPSTQLVSKDLEFENLERYVIIVGGMPVWEIKWDFQKKKTFRKLSLLLDTTSINHLQHNIKRLMRRAEALCLQELKGIKSVVHELDKDGFPELKHLMIQTDYEIQFIVNVETEKSRAFPELESLHLRNLLKLEKICNGRLMEDSFCKLSIVKVSNCKHLESLFSFSMANELPCLEKIKVSDCSILKAIVEKKCREDDCVSANDAVGEKIEFVQLRKLSLKRLPQLINFYSGVKMHKLLKTDVQFEEIFSEKEEPNSFMPFFKEVSFSKLEELILSEISNLICIWSKYHPSILSFKNLRKLRVKKCDGLKYLFTPSIIMSMEQLQILKIQSCVMMKEIVAKDEGETTVDAITLPQLSNLYLKDLPNLTTFYSGVEEMCPDGNTCTAIQPLFNGKANFPNLKKLKVNNLGKIKSIWHNQPNKEDSFCKLEVVEVTKCVALLKIFPSNMMSKIQSVKRVHIFDCDALIEVFEVEKGLNLKEITDDITTASQLRNFHKNLSCENLGNVTVRGCESLKHVFPAFVARSLHQLEQLRVEDCKDVEKIFDDGVEEEEESTTVMFPKLTGLFLIKLPKVECFYPKKHTLDCPVLETLDVDGCDKISSLDLLINVPENHGQNQFEKLLSHLESLTIRSKDMKMMTRKYGLFPSELFLNLRELKISEFHDDDSTNFSSEFLHGLHRLETLKLKNCSFQEVFTYDVEGSTVLLPHLNQLTLYMLPELKCICKEDSLLIPIFEKLRLLYVFECPRLANILPQCSVSFKFLMGLTVENCGGLTKLLRFSTDVSLEHLHWLTISRCQMIEEIVAADHGDRDTEEDHMIIFSKLWCLELVELPRLTNFCTANNYTFKFPSLTNVVVRGCPNMRTFSPGIIVAPMLKGVLVDDPYSEKLLLVDDPYSEKHWNGDLNNTIQHLFSQMEAKRLDATDPSTSSSNHFEPEATQNDQPREEDQTCENGIDELAQTENTMEPRDGKMIVETSEDLTESRDGIEILEKCIEPRKGTEIREEVINNVKEKETEICDEKVAEPARDEGCLESNIVSSYSRKKDFQRSSTAKDFIPLLNKVTQILHTQPLNGMSAQQVQFMEDAFRDLSDMNFSIEWLCPYIEKARDCLSVAEREREISELELKIAEAKIQLQELEENKKALEDKNKAIASSVNLDKSVYDN